MILSKCPLRVSLVGGSTDTEEFLKKYDRGSVISFTPNLYTYISIHENNINKYIINYSQKEVSEEIITIKNPIVRLCMEHFSTPYCTVTFNSNILSSGSGLASSSAFVIAMVKAISMFQSIDMTDKEVCDLSYSIEKRINPLAGQQDVYGCGVGNFKRIDFKHNDQQVYKFLDLSFITKKYNMYLVNTMITRKSTNILKTLDVDKSYYLLETVNKMEAAISSKDEEEFFNIFNQGWSLKKKTSKEIINNPELISMESGLLKSGFISGIKLCGAGGGGYFLVFVSKEQRVLFEDFMRRDYKKNPLINIKIDNSGIAGVRI